MNSHKAYNLALNDRDMMPVVAYGTAGTGKTYGACKAAVSWLKDKKGSVVVIRPNVSFADTNGFLPGTEREKMEPWIRPVSQNFERLGYKKAHQDHDEKTGKLTYLPLEYVQGLTFDNTFVILDEFQNMTFDQIKGFMTRIGKWSKVVLCGDIAQVSPRFKGSGLAEYLDMVEYFNADVHTINFTTDDVLRGDTCKKQIVMFEEWDILKGNKNA